MKSINPKCTNKDSFKYSILISLHYYELYVHKERINKLNKYLNKYKFNWNNYDTCENDNPNISLTVYDENGNVLHKLTNNSKNNAYIVKINNNRYHVHTSFTHEELTDYLLRKVTYQSLNLILNFSFSS